MHSRQADIAIIGGGIVGLATAYQLSQSHRDKRVIVLEKEAEVAHHQTGRNSGVLHSGIYYKPGTLRAKNCRTGKEAMEAFCAEHDVAYDICGKVIVAVSDDELPRLDRIYERGQANGVRCEMIDVDRLNELEPHTAGIKAIHVPEAGIVDYKQVTVKMAEIVKAGGGDVITNARVNKIVRQPDSMIVESQAGEVEAKWIVTCAGLQSDRVTRLSGQKPPAQIVPFRGEYYELKPEAHHLCRTLIYPVPDPSLTRFSASISRGWYTAASSVVPTRSSPSSREGYQENRHQPCATCAKFAELSRLYQVGAQELEDRNGRDSGDRSASAPSSKHCSDSFRKIQSEQLFAVPSGVRAQAAVARW